MTGMLEKTSNKTVVSHGGEFIAGAEVRTISIQPVAAGQGRTAWHCMPAQ